MMKSHAFAFLVVLAISTPAQAETQPSAWSPGSRATADKISTVLVVAQIAAETVANWREPNRWAALRCQGIRTGIVIGAAELTKRLVHRERPDGSDRYSFFSEHTGLAAVNAGWRIEFGVPFTIGVGYGRAAADVHYWSDIGAGAVAGWAARKACGQAK